MNTRGARAIAVAATLLTANACDLATDPATRLANDIEGGADLLNGDNGATFNIRHATPSKSGECTGPYNAQLDELGALILWCEDAAGETVSSHSTSYHARFVETPQTYQAGETLTTELARRGSRAVIADFH